MSYVTVEMSEQQAKSLALTLIRTDSVKIRQLDDGTISVFALAAIYSIDKDGDISFRWTED